MSNPSSNTPEGRPARIEIGPNHYFVGRVHDGHFLVEDDICNGASHFALTHSAPDYKRIPLTAFESNGHPLEYLDE